MTVSYMMCDILKDKVSYPGKIKLLYIPVMAPLYVSPQKLENSPKNPNNYAGR